MSDKPRLHQLKIITSTRSTVYTRFFDCQNISIRMGKHHLDLHLHLHLHFILTFYILYLQ